MTLHPFFLLAAGCTLITHTLFSRDVCILSLSSQYLQSAHFLISIIDGENIRDDQRPSRQPLASSHML